MCPQVPPAAKITTGLMTRAASHPPGRAGSKCSVELLPTLDRIYGDSEHSMTEIDVEAEQIYASVVAQVGELFRYLRLG
jgi:hypothetical protein